MCFLEEGAFNKHFLTKLREVAEHLLNTFLIFSRKMIQPNKFIRKPGLIAVYPIQQH